VLEFLSFLGACLSEDAFVIVRDRSTRRTFWLPSLSGHVRQAFLREVIASVLILSFKAFIFYLFGSVQQCVLLASLVYRVCICVLKRSSNEQRASSLTPKQPENECKCGEAGSLPEMTFTARFRLLSQTMESIP
jgi:hypothetical protein